jgi:hypothetical protein
MPASDSEEISDAEKEIRHRLKKIQDRTNGVSGGDRGLYSKKSTVCLVCNKRYVGAAALRNHMASMHGVADYVLRPENRLDGGGAGSVSNRESPMPPSGADSPLVGLEAGRRRGGKRGLNTRCFPCNKTFMHRPGYKNHLKKMHGGVEPAENRDPENLAKPDDRIVCLICVKKFTTVIGLKLHIQRQHLGITAAAENNEEEEEELYEEEEEGVAKAEKQETDGQGEAMENGPTVKREEGEEDDPLAVATPPPVPTPSTGGGGRGGRMVRLEARPLPADLSDEEKRLIEKMFYNMRKYGCRSCPIRFNNKSKLAMHEAVHAKFRRPVLCPYCERSYSRRDKLRLHISRQHVGQPIPDFSPPPSMANTPRRSYIPASYAALSSVDNSPSSSVRMEDRFDIGEAASAFEGRSTATRPWEALGFRQLPKYRKSEFPVLPDGRFQCPECELSFDLVKAVLQRPEGALPAHLQETSRPAPRNCVRLLVADGDGFADAVAAALRAQGRPRGGGWWRCDQVSQMSQGLLDARRLLDPQEDPSPRAAECQPAEACCGELCGGLGGRQQQRGTSGPARRWTQW